MGNLLARLLGDATKDLDKNAPFPVSELMTNDALAISPKLCVLFYVVNPVFSGLLRKSCAV